MKEMIYQAEFKREVIDIGNCLGFLSLGKRMCINLINGKK